MEKFDILRVKIRNRIGTRNVEDRHDHRIRVEIRKADYTRKLFTEKVGVLRVKTRDWSSTRNVEDRHDHSVRLEW